MTDFSLLKIILLGDSNVGKTALINKYVKNIFTHFNKNTVGVDFTTRDFVIGDNIATLQIWDTAGLERYDSLYTSYYRGIDGCVLVYDLTNLQSFEKLNHWYNQFISYAAPKDKKHFPFVLVGNKMDIPSRKVSTIQAEEWCNSKNQCPYFETSAKDGINVDFAFEKVAEMAIRRKIKPSQYIPSHCPLPPKNEKDNCKTC